MAIKMTKRGEADNEITYQFVCDATADLNKIEHRYITLGSIAIVIHGDAGLEMYMADSDRQWVNLSGANNDDEASSPQADQGQADSMVLGE